MAALLVHDHRVAGAAEPHLGDLTDEGVVQGRGGVRAGDLDLAHVGQVEDPGGVAHGPVLSQVRGVAQGHVPAAEVGEGGS